MDYLKKHREAVWLIAILALSALLRLAFLHEPFETDEGYYATIAQNILRGGLPYRDAIDIKPPGVFYLYTLAISLFGATTEAVRTFTALYSLLTVLAVYWVARHLAGARAGIGAALVYSIFSSFPRLQGSGSNTEVFLVLPLTLAVWFFLRADDSQKRSQLVWSGLCAGLAMLIKQMALPMVALLLLLIPFFKTAEARLKATIFNLISFLAPMVLCALVVVSYFALRGGLDDLFYWTVDFPLLRYRDSGVTGPSLGGILEFLASSLIVPVLLGIPSALWLAGTKRTIGGLLPLLMIATVSLDIVLPGKYFPHYFIMIIPFLAIPAGIGLVNIPRMPKVPAGLALLALLAAFVFSGWENYKFYTVYSPETVSTEKYGGPLFVESVSVARYLREHTQPDDYIFQWGLAPELYFLADRRCPNPFLVSPLLDWAKDPGQATDEMLRSLSDKRPAYIVFQPRWSFVPGGHEIYNYVQKNCTQERQIGYALIFHCSSK